MRFVFAIQLVSILVLFQPDVSLTCDTANWWGSFDREGWSVCANDKTYLTGFMRSKGGGDNGLWLLEEGSCCAASDPSFANQPATCYNANWVATLDAKNVWALCRSGYYMEGMRRSGGSNLYNIEEAKCCHPRNHADAYAHCYDEDVTVSFDNAGWSKCKQAGYYMAGFYKSSCEQLYCIEKFRCCKMKTAAVNGGWTAFGAWGECSAACGAGQQERLRTCTNPPPSNGGAQCSGSNKETQGCNNGPCKVNGGWSDFGDWTECSAECGGGIQERARTCTNPPPSNGGDHCVGDNKESQICNPEPCVVVKVNGGWSKWSDYGECSKACGKGKHYKTRTCTDPPPSGGGKDCKGKSRKGKACNNGKCKE